MLEHDPIVSRRAVALMLGLIAAVTVARFATLGVHGFWYDEAVTPERILLPGLVETLDWVLGHENHPPLWYLLAWPVETLVGDGEVALRMISALSVTAMIPVGYLIGLELRSKRAGLILATLVATAPFLWWYSQEARPYALYALFSAFSFLYLLRSLRSGSSADLSRWAVSSALAQLTHYFAVFPIAAGACWLLASRSPNPRIVRRAVTSVAALELALVPLILSAQGGASNDWIAEQPLGERVWRLVTSPVSDTARPETIGKIALAAAAGLVGWALLRRAGAGRALAVPLTVAAAAAVPPLALALIGSDYFLARNSIAWLVPALAALAVTVDLAPRVIRYAVMALMVAAFAAAISRQFSDPEFRRDDWRGTVERLEALDPRPPLVVGGHLSWGGLSYYLDRDEITDDRVRVSLLATAGLVADRPDWLPRSFRRTSHLRLGGGVIVDTWSSNRPVWVDIPPAELFTQGSFRLGPAGL